MIILNWVVQSYWTTSLVSGGWTVKERVALLTGDALQDQTASGAGLGATSTSIGVIAP